MDPKLFHGAIPKTKETMPQILVRINPTGKKNLNFNITKTYYENKSVLNMCSKDIKKLENYICEKEIEVGYSRTSGKT